MTQDGISYLDKVEESLVSLDNFYRIWKFVIVVIVIELLPFIAWEVFVEYIILGGSKGNVKNYVRVIDFLTKHKELLNVGFCYLRLIMHIINIFV